MLGPNQNRPAAQPPQSSQSNAHAAGSERTPFAKSPNEHQARIAQLVADGQVELPLELPQEQLRDVIDLVRNRRRQRLVSHIARCIAIDILKTGSPPGKHEHDQATV
jgi:hypothetical protein